MLGVTVEDIAHFLRRALPRTGGLQNLHSLIIGAPHRFHEIENVRSHQHFATSQQAATHCG
jgi:hypothetical protein